MNWEATAAVAAIFGSIVALTGMFWQMNALRRSLQSSTYQTVMDSANAHWELVARHRKVFDVFYNGADFDLLGPDDQTIAEVAFIYVMNWHETTVLHSELYKAVPRHAADQWKITLRQDLQIPVVARLWEKHGRFYHPRLRARVELEQRRLRKPPVVEHRDAAVGVRT